MCLAALGWTGEGARPHMSPSPHQPVRTHPRTFLIPDFF